MVRLTEEMIMARTRVSDLCNVKKLSCWGSNLDDVSVVRRLRNVEMIALRLMIQDVVQRLKLSTSA